MTFALKGSFLNFLLNGFDFKAVLDVFMFCHILCIVLSEASLLWLQVYPYLLYIQFRSVFVSLFCHGLVVASKRRPLLTHVWTIRTFWLLERGLLTSKGRFYPISCWLFLFCLDRLPKVPSNLPASLFSGMFRPQTRTSNCCFIVLLLKGGCHFNNGFAALLDFFSGAASSDIVNGAFRACELHRPVWVFLGSFHLGANFIRICFTALVSQLASLPFRLLNDYMEEQVEQHR